MTVQLEGSFSLSQASDSFSIFIQMWKEDLTNDVEFSPEDTGELWRLFLLVYY